MALFSAATLAANALWIALFCIGRGTTVSKWLTNPPPGGTNCRPVLLGVDNWSKPKEIRYTLFTQRDVERRACGSLGRKYSGVSGAGKRNRTPDLLITNQYKHKGLVAEPYSDIVILFIVVENAFRVGCSWGHIKYVATLSYFQTNMLE